MLGDPKHYDRGACVDLVQLRGFLLATQPKLVEAFALNADGPVRRQFWRGWKGSRQARRDRRAAQGIEHGPHHVDLFYGTPSPGNATARSCTPAIDSA